MGGEEYGTIFNAIPMPLNIVVLVLPLLAYVWIEHLLWKGAVREGLFEAGYGTWLVRDRHDPERFAGTMGFRKFLAGVQVFWIAVMFIP
jgi:hypothetical protein